MSPRAGDGHTVHFNEMISVIRFYYEKRIEYLEEENKTVQRKMLNLEEVGAPFVFLEIIGLTLFHMTFWKDVVT